MTGKKNRCVCETQKPPEAQKQLKAEGVENQDDKQTQVKRRPKPNEVRFATNCECVIEFVCMFEGGKKPPPSSVQTLNYLSSSSCWLLCCLLLSGLFRCHGDGSGAVALQASARFVRSCVQVNIFCSQPSVQAQICMRVGRLGWKRSRGRQRARGRRAGKKEGKKKARDKGGKENSDFFPVCRY